MLSLMQRTFQTRGILSTARLLSTSSTIQLLNPKSTHMTFVHCNNSSTTTVPAVQNVQLGYMQRFLKKIRFPNLQKYVIRSSCIKFV